MDDAGDVAAQVRLDAWGNAAIEGDAELVPHRFPGQWHDPETELHYNRHRHYDPATGQYVSRDPIGLRGGLRAYGYVADPTTWSDALGLAGRPAAGAGCGDAPGGGAGGHLERFGSGPESAAQLAADAARAEASRLPPRRFESCREPGGKTG